jgi:hypothetical protein
MIRDSKESFAIKAKGEKLQKDIEALLQGAFPDHANAIKSNKMSAHGEDIQITSSEAKRCIPFSFEAKWKRKGFTNIYSAYEQAERQVSNTASTLDVSAGAVVQQEGHQPLIVMNLEDWLKLITRASASLANDNREPE